MNRLYTAVVGTRGNERHLIHATGSGGVFPRALCDEGIRLRDEPSLRMHRECLRRALVEIALTLSQPLGFDQLGVTVAMHASGLSHEEEPIAETA